MTVNQPSSESGPDTPIATASVVAPASHSAQATPLDRLFQLGYILAYRLLVLWWYLRHPATEGAICAVWSGGRILLVRSPYRPYYSFPGGFIDRGETGLQAAVRELKEEVKISMAPEQLTFARKTEESREHREEHTQIFEIEMDIEPQIQIDNREIIEAVFHTPAEALKLHMLPPARQYILDKAKQLNIPVD